MILPSSVFSIGVFDEDGKYVYFVSKENPVINVSVKSLGERVTVNKSVLNVDNKKLELEIGETLNPTENLDISFRIDEYEEGLLLDFEKVFFWELEIFNFEDKKINPRGDPTSFEIKLDKTKPELILPKEGEQVFLTNENKELSLVFSEKISKHTIQINGEEFLTFQNPSKFERDFQKNFKIEFNEDDLIEGENLIKIIYEDIAENKNENSFLISFRGGDIGLDLLTSKDDSNLKYFYDENFVDFFNKTIFSSEDELKLTLITNKKSKCFFSTSLLEFDTFNNVRTKSEFDTQDNIKHTLNIDVGNKIWVACQNSAFIDDIIYLNDIMGFKSDLIELKKYVGPKIEITNLFPENLVTGVPFNIDVRTNARAVCKHTFQNTNDKVLETQNNILHSKKDVSSSNGRHPLKVSCFDSIGDTVQKTNTLEIDPEGGVKVVSFNPEFTDKSTITVDLTLSEDALCKFSRKQEKSQDFPSLTQLTGTGLTRAFTMSSLTRGDNFAFIYCQKGNEVPLSATLKIIFDNLGPQIENFTFVNKGIPSEFVGSNSEISFEFDVKTLIPIDTYFVKLELENETVNTEILSNSATITENFENAKKISIIAQNKIGKNSSRFEKSFKFDLVPPTTNIIKQGDRIRISCFDSNSGCHEIKYSFSDSGVDCKPSRTYNISQSLPIEDKGFICAKSIDVAGNEDFKLEVLVKEFKIDEDLEDRNITEIINEINENDEVEKENSFLEDIDPFDRPSFDNEEEGISIVVIGSIVFLLLLVGGGGGGFYAYKKGYLNEQLEKMGVLKTLPRSKEGNSRIYGNQPNNPSSLTQRTQPKGKKDDHLKRLNSFIDDTLDKRKKVFNNFNEKGKGKTRDYEDTLLNKKDEEFDEFYEKKEDKSKSSKNLKEDAEDFENYHKSKKAKR